MNKLAGKSRRKIALTLTALFISLITFYIVSNWSEFANIRVESPRFLLVLAVGAILNLYATGAMIDSLLKLFGLHIQRKESFGLASITRFGNQVAPGKLGFFVRAGYLKNKYDFTLASSISTIAVSHLLMYIVSSFLGLTAIIALSLAGTEIPRFFVFLLLSIFIAMITILLMPSFTIPFLNKWKWAGSRLSDFNEGWSKMKEKPRTLLFILSWSILSVFSAAMVAYGGFNSINASIGFVEAVFIASITILSAVIGLTPAGIGINEGLTVAAGSALGIPVAVSLTAALIKRAFMFGISAVLASVFSRYLFNSSFRDLVSQLTDTGPRSK